MKKKKMIFRWLFGSLLILILIGVSVFGYLSWYSKNELKHLTISTIDFTQLNDGVYSGSYTLFPVSVSVTVSVSDHCVTAINITKHFNGRGKPAEVIIDRILADQTLQVDTISNATYSSNAILKAVEQALINEH